MNGSIDADVRLVGQRIAVRRIDAGYSQEKFAEMVGISKTALGKIERGDSAPKTETLISVCRELHASPNELLPDDLSQENGLDPEMLQMAAKVDNLSPFQKKQFYAMMKVVLAGIKNPDS